MLALAVLDWRRRYEREQARLRAEMETTAAQRAAEARAEEAQRRADEQTRAASRLRRLAIGLAVAAVAAFVTLAVALIFYKDLKNEEDATFKAELKVRVEAQQARSSAQQATSALVKETEAEARTQIALTEAKTQSKAAEKQTKRAYEQRARAEQKVTELYEERGRSALLSGDPRRGLLYLDEAVQRDRGNPSARLLLARAFSEVGYQSKIMQGHSERISHVHISPDGKLLLTASPDSTIRIWDLATGKLQHVLVGHTDAVTEAVFSPKGDRILSGSLDGTARLWSTRDGALFNVLGQATARFGGGVVTSAKGAPTDHSLALGQHPTRPEPQGQKVNSSDADQALG